MHRQQQLPSAMPLSEHTKDIVLSSNLCLPIVLTPFQSANTLTAKHQKSNIFIASTFLTAGYSPYLYPKKDFHLN